MRMAAATGLVLAASSGLMTPAEAASKANDLTCNSFMRAYPQSLSGFKVTFERPLTITRDLTGDDDGVEVHILATDAEVDGTLKCKGDEFRRFEVRVDAPVPENVVANLVRFEQAALTTVFRWDNVKAGTVVAAMTADADEYLRASIQRGDTFQAGKVEYHQGGRYDLGLIWTESDHTFVVTSQDER